MHELYVGRPLPSFPFVDFLVRAYGKWEEKQYPKETVRCGIDASAAQMIRSLGMQTSDMLMLRDCAAFIFSYCLNGLRDSSTMSIEASKVNFSRGSQSCRLSYWKGRKAISKPLVSYSRISEEVSSPLDVFLRWKDMRGNHRRFFGLPGKPDEYQKESLSRALQRCLAALEIVPPPGEKYTSHSLRIGAHSEQVLLGTPLPIRMARFGWGKSSEDMANIYFDPTIRTTGASVWFFGAHYLPTATVERLPRTVSVETPSGAFAPTL